MHVTYAPEPGAPRAARAFAATLGLGLKSRVPSGENAGRTLEHSFTALALAQAPLRCGEKSCATVLELPPPAATAPRTALAVWVEDGEGVPLQAAGTRMSFFIPD